MLQNRSIGYLGEPLQIFEQLSLEDFHEYKMSMGLFSGEKPQLSFKVVMFYIRSTGNFVL